MNSVAFAKDMLVTCIGRKSEVSRRRRGEAGGG